MPRIYLLALAVIVVLVSESVIHADGIDTARGLVRQNRYHEAFEMLNKVLASEPENPRALAVLGEVQYFLCQFSESRKTLERSVELGGSEFVGRASPYLAMIEFYLGHDTEAQKYLATTDPADFVAKKLPHLLDAEGFQAKRTKNYVLYFTPGMAKAGADGFAARVLEQVHKTYSKMFTFEGEKILHRVYLFDEVAEFRNFAEKVDNIELGKSGSYYSANLRVVMVLPRLEGERALGSHGFSERGIGDMFRMGFHQFSDMYVYNLPPWFGVGAAEYFAQSKLTKKYKIKIGTIRKQGTAKRPSRYQLAKRAVEERSFLPLNTLLTMSDDSFWDPSNNRGVFNSAQSWSFVYFLLHSKGMRKNGRKLLNTYFMTLKGGETRQQAFAETFGRLDLKKLEKAWVSYVKSF